MVRPGSRTALAVAWSRRRDLCGGTQKRTARTADAEKSTGSLSPPRKTAAGMATRIRISASCRRSSPSNSCTASSTEVSSSSDSTIHTERFWEGYVGHREPQLVQHRPGEYGSFLDPRCFAVPVRSPRFSELFTHHVVRNRVAAAVEGAVSWKIVPDVTEGADERVATPGAITWMSIRFELNRRRSRHSGDTQNSSGQRSCIRQARDTPAQWPNALFRDGPTPYAGRRTRPTHARCWGSRE